MAQRESRSLRVRVAAVMISDGKLVLVRHRAGHRRYHLLPGGGMEAGEAISDALCREVREETGLECKPLRPLFISDTIYPDLSRHIVHVTFLADITGGEITETPDDPRVEAVDLVDPSELAGLDLRPPIASQLAEAIECGFAQEARYLGSLWVDEPE